MSRPTGCTIGHMRRRTTCLVVRTMGRSITFPRWLRERLLVCCCCTLSAIGVLIDSCFVSAGCAAWITVYPIDVCKTRIQTQTVRSTYLARGLCGALCLMRFSLLRNRNFTQALSTACGKQSAPKVPRRSPMVRFSRPHACVLSSRYPRIDSDDCSRDPSERCHVLCV